MEIEQSLTLETQRTQRKGLIGFSHWVP